MKAGARGADAEQVPGRSCGWIETVPGGCGVRCCQRGEPPGAHGVWGHSKGRGFGSKCTEKPLQNFKLKIFF